MRLRAPAAALLLLLAGGAGAQSPAEWPAYGRDPGGARHSPLTQVTRDNVARLETAWTYHTGEAGVVVERGRPPALEATPLVVDGTMYLSTPLGRAIALDPATGKERWRYDPGVDPQRGYGDFASRGVAYWRDRGRADGPCARRVFVATIDARLVALDAAAGRPCAGFGSGGVVDLRRGLRVPPFEFQAYEVTSPPAVVGDVVVAGSAIADNARLAPASGEVRGFDARTGALRWTFDPIPQDARDPAHATWRDGSAARTGGGNVWSLIVADPERDLVFLPTSSPAPDYFGGMRRGENRYASSLVALRASTGKVAWHFQTVHHDLWDYDNAAPPALAVVKRAGAEVPAVLQATKTGMLFVLHRETGDPVFPVEERPVPRSTVADEEAWPTQPFGIRLSPHSYAADEAWGPTPEARAWCREQIAPLRNEGIFTPPSLEGTLAVPGNIGGAHWGGVAVDAARQVAVVPVNRIPAVVQLLPQAGFDREGRRREDTARGLTDWEYTRMGGTPYVMRRRLLLGPTGLPCSPPPFGSLVAVSLATGRVAWDVPLGAMPALKQPLTYDGGRQREGAPPPPANAGSVNLGGPIVTASGLVFIGATLDRMIRAFDVETGRELWKAALPAGARATPMTYEAGGRQYVVIAAGGSGPFGTGDAIVAFALPAPSASPAAR
jgi:quinoprotein glucose dehydrogenase